MAKYYCKTCNEFIYPSIEDDNESPTGEYMTCPNCGFDDLKEAGVCTFCGDPTRQGDVLCSDCLENFNDEIREIWANWKLTGEEMGQLLENFIDYEI